MKIIRNIENLFKARYGSFTEVEFSSFCKIYGNLNGVFSLKLRKNAERVLKIYLTHHTPTQSQLNALYSYGDKLAWLYLESISADRKLTECEQMYFATIMNFGPMHHFPRELDTKALSALFESGDVRRIATYVKDYALPERFELELIRRYAMQKPYQSKGGSLKCDYRTALSKYLSSGAHPKCVTEKVQNELLNVLDEELWVELCSNQNMSENVLSECTVYELIERGLKRPLRALLMHSFLPTCFLQSHLSSRLPQLKWELEISKVRHALRKLEKQEKAFWGVEAPDRKELKIIEESYSAVNQLEYIKDKIETRLKYGIATPYFCAWATDEYPHLGEEAYKSLRKFAEKFLHSARISAFV